VSVEKIALRYLRRGEKAVGAEQDDGVEGDEERAEDAGDDGFPGYAGRLLEAGDEEVESDDEC
jgi:hypothetical protein